MTSTVLPALAALMLATPIAAAAESAKFEGADLYRLSMVIDPQVSPDGKRVLFTRAFFDIQSDSRQGELWLAEIRAGGRLDRHLLIGAGAKASGARWSPDGTRIAYLAAVGGKPQLHVMALAEGIGRPITDVKAAPGDFAWSPDGTQIAYTAEIEAQPVKVNGMPAKPEGATWAPAAKVITSFHYRSDGGGYRTPGFRHLFVVPAAGGGSRQITKGDFDHVEEGGSFSWTPDGRSIAASATRRPDRDLRPRDSDLWLIPVDGAAPRQLTTADGSESEPEVSPDGRWIAYVGGPDVPTFYAQPHLWVMPIGGGTPRDLTAALDREVQGPVWSKDGRRLSFLYYDRGFAKIAEVPASGGKITTFGVTAGGTRLYLPSSGTSFSAASGTLAYPTLYEDRPAGLGVARDGKQIAMLDFNTDWRKIKRIGRMEEIRYTSSVDGREIQGWIQYPPDFDPSRKYPLVLDIHGGPNTDYGPGFSITHQLYAAAGYIVLFTNPRGSIGYGEQFANLIDKTYPSQDHDDLMSGVDAMVKRPYVDAGNLFIGGGSGGGVLTTYAVGKTDRFRAAVALRPVTDWSIQALTSDLQSLTTRYWMADKLPWEKPEDYWQRSTISLVGNVKTPVMLITGEADYRTPIAQTEAYFQALKFRGVEAAMVRLPEAGHGMGRPSQWLASILLPIDWFDKHRVPAAGVTAANK